MYEIITFVWIFKYYTVLFTFSVRLISIAAQKFISDVANDALQHCKTRSSATQGSTNKVQKDKANKKYTLTVEDLAPALNENYGIVTRKAHYFV